MANQRKQDVSRQPAQSRAALARRPGAPLWAQRLVGLALLSGLAALVEAFGVAGADGRLLLWVFILYAAVALVRAGRRERLRSAETWSQDASHQGRPGAFGLGAAIAAAWLSSISLLGLGGALFLAGRDGLAFLFGWLGGFLLLALAIAPALRRLGVASAPAYIGKRYGSAAETAAAVIAAAAAFGLLAAQFSAAGLALARAFDASYGAMTLVAGAALSLWLWLARDDSARLGARDVAVAAFAGLAFCYLAPAAWMAATAGDGPVPQLGYLFALERIEGLETRLRFLAAPSPSPHLEAWNRLDAGNAAALILALALGVASQPHLLGPYHATAAEPVARRSLVWAFALILLVLLAAPAYAAYAKLEIYRPFAENDGRLPLLEVPDWLFRWSAQGETVLATLCGAPAPDERAVAAACAAQGLEAGPRLERLAVDPDMVVLAAPDIARAPLAFLGLLIAGVLMTALLTAQGGARALGASFARELYVRRMHLGASIAAERAAAAAAAPACALLASLWAATRPADLLTLATWAFSLGGAGLFPAIALGLLWRGATTAGAVAGMGVGFSATLFYQIGATVGLDGEAGTGDEIVWWGLDHLAAGAFGLVFGALALVLVSLTAPESRTSTASAAARGGRTR